MANIAIPNLPSLSIVTDPDLLIINSGGLSRKTTVSNLLSNVRADLTSISVSLDNKVNATNTTVLNSLTASVIQLNQNIVSNSAALAQQISVVNVTLGNSITASVNTLNQAIISNSSILAQQINSVNAYVLGVGAAAVSALNQAIISNSSILAQQINSVNAYVLGYTDAAVSTLNQAIASNSSVLAQSITTVSTTLGSVSGSVTTLSTSVNGLNNTWSVKLDSNGYISGITSVNNGNIANIVINADNFFVSKAGANGNVAAFSINALANPPTLTFLGKISAGSIESGSISTANIYISANTTPSANYFAIEGVNQRLTVRDGQNRERIRMGYLSNNAPGTDSSNYGLNIYDVTGNIILGANGLGSSVVYPANMPLGTTTVAYGAWAGSGNIAVNTAGTPIASFNVNVQATGEGVLIMSSGLFNSYLATLTAPTPPSPPPPAPPPPDPIPPYVPPPEYGPDQGSGG